MTTIIYYLCNIRYLPADQFRSPAGHLKNFFVDINNKNEPSNKPIFIKNKRNINANTEND